MWQSEKSNLTGSTGSIRRSDAVIEAAILHPGEVYAVSPRHRPRRITCVSSGTTSRAGATRVQIPRSISSRRTIHLRNRLSRLHALPADGRGKK